VETVEVWRLHPSAAASREANFQLTLNWTGSGDRGALLIVEDRHTDRNASVGFAGAELADTNDRPEIYDHERGIDYTDCQEPVLGHCSSYLDGGRTSDGVTWGYLKPTVNGKPDPTYLWHDFYVGALNAHIPSIRLTGATWTVTRATNATMALVENQDTSDGAGAHVANYTVEHFNGVQYTVPKGSWAAIDVRLPCSNSLIGVSTPGMNGRLSGYTLPDDGRPYIPMSCQGTWYADTFATVATTVRLAMTSSAPTDNWSATQNLDRLVALIVKPIPKARSHR
jgi:hypothetical protein